MRPVHGDSKRLWTKRTPSGGWICIHPPDGYRAKFQRRHLLTGEHPCRPARYTSGTASSREICFLPRLVAPASPPALFLLHCQLPCRGSERNPVMSWQPTAPFNAFAHSPHALTKKGNPVGLPSKFSHQRECSYRWYTILSSALERFGWWRRCQATQYHAIGIFLFIRCLFRQCRNRKIRHCWNQNVLMHGDSGSAPAAYCHWCRDWTWTAGAAVTLDGTG